jgi:hypothetical protein
MGDIYNLNISNLDMQSDILLASNDEGFNRRVARNLNSRTDWRNLSFWDISNEEFVDSNALTLAQITKICKQNNPQLVTLGFDIAIYSASVNAGINPKILLASLAQEQGWCKAGGYNKAFGVGPGGKPTSFSEKLNGGAQQAAETYKRLYDEGYANLTSVLVNYDPRPYREEKAVFRNGLSAWRAGHPNEVRMMDSGVWVTPVNAAMYAKLHYTPWTYFPPQNSYPLRTWYNYFRSF